MAESKTWGGRRAGAGRPKSSIVGSHVARPELKRLKVAHITMRLRSGFGSMRTDSFYETFERAASRARRFGLRVVEYTLLDRRIEMLCEVRSNEDLERAFKSLNTTLAIALKKASSKSASSGPVFLGRFRLNFVSTNAEARDAMKQVLLAPSREGLGANARDPFSSAARFRAWGKLLDASEMRDLDTDVEAPAEIESRIRLITASPQSFLLRAGWSKA